MDAARLAKLGIFTVRDLLMHLPFGWDEYGEPSQVANLVDGKQATVVGTITSISAKRSKYKKMQLTEATLQDDSGGVLKLVWFNQAFVAKQLSPEERVAVAGMVRGRFGVFEMRNPLYEKVSASGPKRLRDLMPRYHLVKGLTSKKMAGWIESILPLADAMEDVLPADVLRTPSPASSRGGGAIRPPARERAGLDDGAKADGLRGALRAAGRVRPHAGQHSPPSPPSRSRIDRM